MQEQLEKLIKENEELKERLKVLEEENQYLWFLMEEQKNSENAIGQAVQSMLQEVLEEELLRNMKPVGDA